MIPKELNAARHIGILAAVLLGTAVGIPSYAQSPVRQDGGIHHVERANGKAIPTASECRAARVLIAAFLSSDSKSGDLIVDEALPVPFDPDALASHYSPSPSDIPRLGVRSGIWLRLWPDRKPKTEMIIRWLGVQNKRASACLDRLPAGISIVDRRKASSVVSDWRPGAARALTLFHLGMPAFAVDGSEALLRVSVAMSGVRGEDILVRYVKSDHGWKEEGRVILAES